MRSERLQDCKSSKKCSYLQELPPKRIIYSRACSARPEKGKDMKARDVISLTQFKRCDLPSRYVAAETPLLEVLPMLLEAPDRRLAVRDDSNLLGVIDETSLMNGLGRMLPARDDCSIIEIECAPHEYSASLIARAVEDADAHLVNLISRPGSDDRMRVTLRVRQSDPTPAIRSLERYGFEVVEAAGSSFAAAEVSEERLSALQVYLNV